MHSIFSWFVGLRETLSVFGEMILEDLKRVLENKIN